MLPSLLAVLFVSVVISILTYHTAFRRLVESSKLVCGCSRINVEFLGRTLAARL